MRTSILITLFLFAATLHAEVFDSRAWISFAIGKRFVFEVTGERVLKTPVWKTDTDPPPLAPRKAEQLATAKFHQLISNTSDWKREHISLEDTGDGQHWIYVVEFRNAGIYNAAQPFLKVIVLMDGTVVEPKISEDKKS